MIKLHYERHECQDIRFFKDSMELVEWMIRECEIEPFTIIEIEIGEL